MKNLVESRHKKFLIIAMMFLVLMTITINFSYGADTISLLDSGTDYLIYTNDYNKDFKYAFSDNTNAPAVYYQCQKDTNGYSMIKVPKSSILTAKYLYTQTMDGVARIQNLEVDYTKALKSEDIDHISTLTDTIKVSVGERDITITDKGFTDLKYILVKLNNETTDYNTLVSRAATTQNFSTQKSTPIDSIDSMQQFFEIFKKLLPNDTDNRWEVVPKDNKIEEPLDTKTGDIYVLWIMGTNKGTGEIIKDLQILKCLREDETIEVPIENPVVKTRVIKLPKTGADFILEGLIIATIVIIALVYLRIRSLKRKI